MITICIPTLNRPFHLRRILKFYEKTALDFDIFIGVSNTESEFKKNVEFSKNLKNFKNIHFLHNPRKNVNNVIETETKLLEKVKTKYVVFCPDDDFLIPSTLRKMAFELEKDASYFGIIGNGFIYDPRQNYFSNYKLIGINQENSLERINYFLNNYFAILFALCRTNQQLNNFKSIYKTVDVIQDEIYPSCNMSIIGKIKNFNETQLIRPMEGQGRVNMQELDENNIHLKTLINTLANNIKKKDNIDKIYSEKIIKNALLNNISNKNKISVKFRKIQNRLFNFYCNRINKNYLRRHLNSDDINIAIDLVKSDIFRP